MRKRLNGLAAAAVVAALAVAPAGAQNRPKSSPLVDALAACKAIADAGQRLACFDKASADIITATTTGEVSVVDRADMRQARRSLFGFSLPKLPLFSGDKSGEDVPDSLTSKVASVRHVGHDRYQVRIEEGNALWETLESYSSFHAPKVGGTVEIKRGPLGSYLLRFDGRRGVKGKRIG